MTVRELIANTLDTEERMLGVIYVVDSDAKGDWREHEIIEEEYEMEVVKYKRIDDPYVFVADYEVWLRK